MLGIEEIASYLPPLRMSNFERKDQFAIDDHFIEKKIGFLAVSRMEADDTTSTLCEKAYARLADKIAIDKNGLQAVIVVTQNPDTNIPHVSAILHGRLGLPEQCACFDVSLGCSGYVHGLSIALSFMMANGMSRGLLFTADPYSKIIDNDDKSTALLFGDGATVTLLSDTPTFVPGQFSFGTIGQESAELRVSYDALYMNGRAIFNFAARHIPRDVKLVLAANGLEIGDIDSFVFHQGSRYIVEAIANSLGVPKLKVPFGAAEYGNTVSSSVPMILENEMLAIDKNLIFASGFGVGLSWASTILTRTRVKS
ncbi:3-oxoacyl-ACP synthase [Afipia sp. Root123D2]|uniref:ketoacyl-ACP synthase III n=1 Tax=Afipia sp. Root123D2 TaxID=1736436 RepID=UPI0006F7B21D|nr:ketoacyl-ACP synthase III [Afipia sp. Root123D2]KQW22304.1 3-oxoacyl-ACP synthase [Afipia sp. Root123D2]